jgi:hypothetical protein
MFFVDLFVQFIGERVEDLVHSVQASAVKGSLGGFLENKETPFPARNMATVKAKDEKGVNGGKLLCMGQDSLLSGVAEVELVEVSLKGLEYGLGWVCRGRFGFEGGSEVLVVDWLGDEIMEDVAGGSVLNLGDVGDFVGFVVVEEVGDGVFYHVS